MFRSAYLISSSLAAHVVPHGLHADVALGDEYTYSANPADGVTVANASALAFADIETSLNISSNVRAARQWLHSTYCVWLCSSLITVHCS